MSKEVSITCSPKGLERILVDNVEIDCSEIKDKKISDWFYPAHNMSGWKGLMPEIYSHLADDQATPSFLFIGPPGFEKEFFRCLESNNVKYDGAPSDEERADFRYKDAYKEELRQNYSEALNLYEIASELGHIPAKLKCAEYLMQRKGIEPNSPMWDHAKGKANPSQSGKTRSMVWRSFSFQLTPYSIR